MTDEQIEAVFALIRELQTRVNKLEAQLRAVRRQNGA